MPTQFSDFFHVIFTSKKELEEVYLNLVIRKFAFAMISVFIPIYLLQSGFTFTEVMYYIFIWFLFQGMVSPVAAFLSAKIGLKHTILMSTFVLISSLIILFWIEIFQVSIYLISALYGTSLSLHWVALNADFADNIEKKKRGKDVALLEALPAFFVILAPIFGASVLLFFNFNFLLLLALAILFVSVIPLFLTHERKDRMDYSWKEMFSVKNKNYFFAFISHGAIDISGFVFWPIFIFLLLGGVMDVGIAISVELFAIAMLTLLVGSWIDRHGKRKIFVIGAILCSVIWILKSFASSYFDVIPLGFLGGIAAMFITVPLFVAACNTAKRNTLEFMTFREMILCFAKCVIVLAVIFFGLSLSTVFIVSGLACLYFLIFRSN